jgi:hypothetical protein
MSPPRRRRKPQGPQGRAASRGPRYDVSHGPSHSGSRRRGNPARGQRTLRRKPRRETALRRFAYDSHAGMAREQEFPGSWIDAWWRSRGAAPAGLVHVCCCRGSAPPSSPMHIRDIASDDIDALTRLHEISFPKTYLSTEQMLAARRPGRHAVGSVHRDGRRSDRRGETAYSPPWHALSIAASVSPHRASSSSKSHGSSAPLRQHAYTANAAVAITNPRAAQ